MRCLCATARHRTNGTRTARLVLMTRHQATAKLRLQAGKRRRNGGFASLLEYFEPKSRRTALVGADDSRISVRSITYSTVRNRRVPAPGLHACFGGSNGIPGRRIRWLCVLARPGWRPRRQRAPPVHCCRRCYPAGPGASLRGERFEGSPAPRREAAAPVRRSGARARGAPDGVERQGRTRR